MKLKVDFSELHASAKKMGGDVKDFVLDIGASAIDRIDADLKTGITIATGDLEYTDNGLLSYKGRQVLLYIQDHAGRVDDALIDGSKGNKYHVSSCATLEKMYQGGRYDRYVVKNDITGYFFIDGRDWKTKEYKEGNAKLKVCKNCLRQLNYKNYYELSKNEVFNNFSLDEFFKTYEAYFRHKPKREAGKDRDGTYTANWNNISSNYRAFVGWACESCKVDLTDHKNLLHTHHKSGVKSDNSSNNLEALCVECHANQEYHQHMSATYQDKKLLRLLRNEQGL